MHFDINTLAIVLSFVNLLQVVVLLVQSRIDRSHRGLGWWTLGMALLSLGCAFLYLRSVPRLTAVAIVANNILLVCGTAFLYIGVLRFFDRREHRALLIAGLAVYIPLVVLLTYVHDDVVMRRVLLWAIMAVLSVLIARAILAYKTRAVAGSAYFLATVFLISGASFFVMMVSTILHPPPPVVFAESRDQVIGAFNALFVTTLFTFGFILLVNQRLHAENLEAKARDAQYRRIVETANEGILSFDRDIGITFTNQQMASMLGYSVAEMLGRPFVDFLAPEELADHARRVQARRRGQDAVYERCFLRRDGARHWALVSARALMDDHGCFAGSFAMFTDINERKRVEAALRDSEEKYRRLVDTAIEGVLSLDSERRITFVNRQLAAMLGYTAQELLGRTYESLVTEDQLGDALVQAELRRQGQDAVYERCFRRKDGERQWLLVSAKAELDAAGAFSGSFGMFTDINERKRTEAIMAVRLRLIALAPAHSMAELLRATLEEAEALTESHIGFYHFLEPDQTTLSMQTWSTNTLLNQCGAPAPAQHYPVDQAGVWVDCIHARRAVIHNDYAALVHRKGLPTGHVPIVRQLVLPVLRGGQIVALLGVGNKPIDYTEEDVTTISVLADLAWDVVESKRADDALRESEARFRAAIDASPDGFVITDTQGRIAMVSPAFLRMRGCAQARDMLGHVNFEFFASEDGDFCRSYLPLILAGKAPGPGAFRLRRVDGSLMDVESNGVLFHDAEGTPAGLLFIVRDITERKRLEATLLHQATTDELTGVANRRHFLNLAAHELKRAARLRQPLALAIIDLDYFKQVNDRYGHAAGDQALKTFTTLCRHYGRDIDVLGRFGGDEFVLLMPGCNGQQASAALERLRAAVAAQPLAYDGQAIVITISVGIAWVALEPVSLDALLRRADQALYESKRAGRNRVAVDESA